MIFKVNKMEKVSVELLCQINWLMTICLSALLLKSVVDLPGSVSVPNSPMAICNLESLLKPLPQTPFYRVVDNRYLFVSVSD